MTDHVLSSTSMPARGAALIALCAAAACAPATPATTATPAAGPTAATTVPATPTLMSTTPSAVGMSNALPARLDSIIHAAIADRAAPAVQVAVGRYGRLVYLNAYGRLTYDDTAAKVDEHTRFDMASLTKVVATTTAAMMLEDEGKLDLDRTVASYVPEFNAPDKKNITVRMLVTHRGGMEAFAKLWPTTHGRAEYLAAINSRPLAYVPGTKSIYSDWDYVLMQAVIERITGETLDHFTETHIFAPIGMMETGYLPDSIDRRHVAPTEIDTTRGGLIWGRVHDENAGALGGVSGHAGLFSTAHDMAIFAQMLLNGGSYGTVRLIRPETVARWTSIQDRGSSRALGWDTPSARSSAGRFFSPRSYGHTGFTGTSVWTDPQRGVWVVLLTNRVYPTRANQKIGKLRRDVADAVQEAITNAPLIDWEATRNDH